LTSIAFITEGKVEIVADKTNPVASSKVGRETLLRLGFVEFWLLLEVGREELRIGRDERVSVL